MPTTYGFSSYSDIWDSVMSDIGQDEKLSSLSPDRVQFWILEACQRISQAIPIKRSRDLLLIQDQDKYYFADSTEPASGTGTVDAADLDVTGVTAVGTGTISTDNTASDNGLKVTGVGTAFKSQLAVGEAIIVGTEIKEIMSIESDTVLMIDEEFDASLSASAFNYSTTKFTREVISGSTIVVNGVSKVVDAVADPYNLTVTTAFSANQSAQAFTVDTVVTELPTEMMDVDFIDREESGEKLPIYFWALADVIKKRQSDGLIVFYTNLETPFCAAIDRDSTGYHLLMYKAPDAHKVCTVHSHLRVKPSLHTADAFTASIPLEETYDVTVGEYVKWKVCSSILHDEKQAAAAKAEYYQALSQDIRSLPAKRRIQVDVT